jgi:hypothetical protein
MTIKKQVNIKIIYTRVVLLRHTQNYDCKFKNKYNFFQKNGQERLNL